MTRALKRALLPIAFLCALTSSAQAEDFQRVPLLEKNVAFWRKVYAVWSINDIALHDRGDLGIVFRVVRVPGHGRKVGGLTRSAAIKKAKGELIASLDRLAKTKPKSCAGLSGVDKEVCDNLAGVDRADKYTRPRDLIRAQNGLRERARAGYISLGRYEKQIREEIRKSGMPQDILALAFVESLFNITAVSHAGAAGMWQFMRPTGREYMHVNSLVDERIDPILATEAAMKYLNSARRMLGAWPLAITSYNYGRAGMKRASQAVGSKDFGVIYTNYKKKRFGFAAKNYYASFLALLDVIRSPERYFPGVKQDAAWRYDIVRLPIPVLAPQLAKHAGLSASTLKSYNPALTRGAREGSVVLPRGLAVRVPYGRGKSVLKAVRELPFSERKKALTHIGRWHRANGKQTLTSIAKRYGAKVDDLSALTGLTAGDKPRKGSKIPIPSGKAGYTLFPDARGLSVPSAPALPEKVAFVPVAPPEDSGPVVAQEDNRPQVKLLSFKVVSIPQPLPAVDLVSGGETEPLAEVDVIAGDSGAGLAARDVPASSEGEEDTPAPAPQPPSS
jgi:membrane-bound lytic murein transglycosylase D